MKKGKVVISRVVFCALTILTLSIIFSSCKNVREAMVDPGLRVELTDVKRYGDAKGIESPSKYIDREGRRWVKYQDELVSFSFAKQNTFEHYYFEITNESGSEIKIDWSEATFIGEEGESNEVLVDGILASKYKGDKASNKYKEGKEYKESITTRYDPKQRVEHAIVPFGQFSQSSSANEVWIACVGKQYGDKIPLGPERETLSKEERDSPLPVSKGKCSFLYSGGIRGRKPLSYGTLGTENIKGTEYSILVPVQYGQRTAIYEFSFDVNKVLV